MNKKQYGFTLIELMVGLVLGLLIVAAGLSVFIAGQRSLNLQSGMGELQENANFGLSILAHDLRQTNLNTTSSQIVNNKASGSGIIFTKDNLPLSLASASTDNFTKQNNNDSATSVKSDQLTIQYIPQYLEVTRKDDCTEDPADSNCKKDSSGNFKKDTKYYVVDNVDCEGGKIDFKEKRVIVQRYFLKEDSFQVPGQPKAYGLYCDAGNYISGDAEIVGIGKNAQQLMQRIDAFNLKLGVRKPDGKSMRYATINEYLDTLMPVTVTDSDEYYNVMSVEVGVLARSTTPLNSESLIDNNKPYKLVGNNLILNTEQKNGSKFLREEFSQVVAFRNTLGVTE